MKNKIRNGLIDYFEIMRTTGLSAISKLPPKTTPNLSTQNLPTQNNTLSTSLPTSPTSTSSPPPPISNVAIDVDNEVPRESLPRESLVVGSVVVEGVGGDKLSRLRLLSEEVSGCTLCAELAAGRTQTVFGTGNPDSDLVFVGEAPGADEDRLGEPFVGRSGKLLTDIITKGMNFQREDVYICNILRCRPPNNRPPSPIEAANCNKFLEETLNIINPKFICCLGSIATKYLLQSDKSIGTMRGKIHQYKNAKVICTYHPSYLLRVPDAKKDTWEDIKLLLKIMKEE